MSQGFDNKNILVIGGSSGIGRGIAESFIKYNANVCITGTRDSIEDYEERISQNIEKCNYQKLDLSNHDNLNNLDLPFNDLDHLICSQGIVAYKRKEFEMDTFKKVVDLNLNSIMASCSFFQDKLSKIISMQSGSRCSFIKSH